jgi:hypothetical protein
MPKELEPGIDYPQLYREFVEWFPDNKACLDYLEKLRWPNGFTCPVCNVSAQPWRQTSTQSFFICRIISRIIIFLVERW